MPTRSDIIDALQFDLTGLADPALNGTGDAPYVFTFQFSDSEPASSPAAGSFSGWTAWSEGQRAAVRDALAHVESFLNVDFVEVTGAADPDIDFGRVSLPGSTAGYGGPSWSYWGDGSLADYDGYAVYDSTIDIAAGQQSLILHEIGHVLGNGHPFSGSATLPDAYDHHRYTLMSYTGNPDNGMRSDAMQIFDILALQARWGANSDHRSGNSTYTGSRTDTVDAVWDAGGTDWFDASGRSSAVVLDLRAAAFSSFDALNDVAIAYDVVIENARGGGGGDTITGNGTANRLIGGGGGDTIEARTGSDILKGGAGRDKLDGGKGADTLEGGRGKDTLDGGKGADTLKGNGGADKFVFRDDYGKDVIRDFKDDTDSLRLDIAGIDTVSEALDAATHRNGHVVFDFGTGLELIVRNITKADLQDDIVLL